MKLTNTEVSKEQMHEIVKTLVNEALSTNITIAIGALRMNDRKLIISLITEAAENIGDVLTTKNKLSLSFISGSRVVSDDISENSFRGYSIQRLFLYRFNDIHIKEKYNFLYSVLPTMAAFKNPKIYTNY